MRPSIDLLRIRRLATDSSVLLEVGYAAALFVLVLTLCRLFQLPLSENAGQGYDGVHYYAFAHQARHGLRPTGPAPFIHRVAIPMLAAAWKSKELLSAFRAISMWSAAAATLLLVVWLRQNLASRWVRLTMITVLVTHWLGPLRFHYYYPALTDSLGWAINLMILILAQEWGRRHSLGALLGLCITALAGTLVRETTLIALLCVPFATNPLGSPDQSSRGPSRFVASLRAMAGRTALLGFAPALVAWLTYQSIRSSVAETGYVDVLAVTRNWFWIKGLSGLALAWLWAFGPLLVLMTVFMADVRRHFARHQHQGVFLLAFVCVGWFMGSDTERLTLWALPVVLVVTGRILEERDLLRRAPGFSMAAAGIMSLTLHWWGPILDSKGGDPKPVPNPWLLGEKVAVRHFFSVHGNANRLDILAAEHLVLFLFLTTWLWWAAGRGSRREHAA